MKTVELYFDFSSPNAYFAALTLPAVVQRQSAQLLYKPMLLGGLFKLLGTAMTPGMSSPEKGRASLRDLERWGEKHGIPFRWPSRFPMNTLTALRGFFALGELGIDERAYVEKVFSSYWAEDRDISDASVMSEIVTQLGGDAQRFLEKIGDPAVKDQLRVATEQARERGVFGAPTLIVGDELFFGKDRMDFVEDCLKQA